MRFRKKPVEIEAFRIGEDDWPDWAWDKVTSNGIILHHLNQQMKTGSISVLTLEGIMTGQYGDYLIKGVKDEIYPCKPDIFEATYEAVE